MTSEIVVMNRYAVTLAADSATTVTKWIDGEKEVRYFKGANKIFQLSNHQPVGMMIYSSADLHGAPWEVLIKDFRISLKDKSFNELVGYVDEFFKFIENHQHIFPQSKKEEIFRSNVITVSWIYVLQINEDKKYRAARIKKSKNKISSEILKKNEKKLDRKDLLDGFEEEELEKALNQYSEDISNQIAENLKNIGMDGEIDAKLLTTICIKAKFKEINNLGNETGVVFAGYGDHEFYPSFKEYKCLGFVNNKLVKIEESSESINDDNVSCITPFATTSMINTFMVGFSEDVYSNTRNQLKNTLEKFGSQLANELGHEIPENFEEMTSKASDSHINEWLGAAFKAHYTPLSNVIGSLPVDEMAELAETLISLQSLKEKVTQPSESVSGPIDVAIISKGDGFIWVRRKHYFEAELNSKFFLRQRNGF